MKKNIIITGAGKGIGKQILFDCIENDNFVYGVIRSKKDFIEIKKEFKGSKNCKLYHGDIKNFSGGKISVIPSFKLLILPNNCIPFE